jgi:hypothetical protein
VLRHALIFLAERALAAVPHHCEPDQAAFSIVEADGSGGASAARADQNFPPGCMPGWYTAGGTRLSIGTT